MASLEFAGDLFYLRRCLNVGACFPPAGLFFDSIGAWSYRIFPLQPPVVPEDSAVERLSLGGAWFSHASRDGSHSIRSTAVVFVFVLLYFWTYLLFPSLRVHFCYGVWVLVT